MRMIAVVAALALSIGCNKKKADPPATPPPAPADAAPVAPATDAALPAGIDAAQAATAPPPTPTAAAKAVCCESTGDATHDSLELSEAVCTGPGLEGDVVKLEDCGVKGEVPIIAKGQTITIAAPGQYV